MQTTCFEVYRKCAKAIHEGVLIVKQSKKDKEFFFQNWCHDRVLETGYHVEAEGRNSYPDFRIVEQAEGYEIKGLAYPGRENSYDANSNIPSGVHNGRQIFYIFGRYPSEGEENEDGKTVLPVTDLVICHGDFLNAYRDYVHENKHVKGFGTFGDIMIRDRKMYVCPTPFAIADGVVGLCTLILPENFSTIPEDFTEVGTVERIEAEKILTGYSFNLETNVIASTTIPNPRAGEKHIFKAYRCTFESKKQVNNK